MFCFFFSSTLNVVKYISATYLYVHCHASLVPYFSERSCCHHMYNYSNPGTGLSGMLIRLSRLTLAIKISIPPSSVFLRVAGTKCQKRIKAQRHLFGSSCRVITRSAGGGRWREGRIGSVTWWRPLPGSKRRLRPAPTWISNMS